MVTPGISSKQKEKHGVTPPHLSMVTTEEICDDVMKRQKIEKTKSLKDRNSKRQKDEKTERRKDSKERMKKRQKDEKTQL